MRVFDYGFSFFMLMKDEHDKLVSEKERDNLHMMAVAVRVGYHADAKVFSEFIKSPSGTETSVKPMKYSDVHPEKVRRKRAKRKK